MAPYSIFYRDLAYVFAAAVAGGLLAHKLRQPLILGYVLAGVLISPLTPGPSVSNVHTLELFAEIGIILLMFSVGLEFSVKDLLREKWVALLGGPLGILLSIGMGMGAGRLLGWTACALHGTHPRMPTRVRRAGCATMSCFAGSDESAALSARHSKRLAFPML